MKTRYGKNVLVGGIIYLYVGNPRSSDVEILHKQLRQLSRSCRGALSIIAELHLGRVPTVHWMDIESVDEDGELAVYSKKWTQVAVGVEKVVNAILRRVNEKAGEYLALGMLRIQEELSSMADAQNPGVSLLNTLKKMLQEQEGMLEEIKKNRNGDEEVKRQVDGMEVKLGTMRDMLERLQSPSQVGRRVVRSPRGSSRRVAPLTNN
jgi:hypothetical protein